MNSNQPNQPKKQDLNENILSLNAQINYITNRLDKETEGSVSKVKDAFKNRRELETIKKGISKKLDDLIEEASPDIKPDVEHLQSQWNKIQPNLSDEREISSLLQTAAAQLKEEMNQIYDKSFSPEITIVKGDKEDRISIAVQSYFDRVSAKTIETVERSYPRTIKALFDLSLKLIGGHYGHKLAEAYTLSFPSVASYQTLFSLLLIDLNSSFPASQFSNALPEVFYKLKETTNYSELLEFLRGIETTQIERLFVSPAEDLSTQELWCRSQLSKLIESQKIPKADLKALQQIFDDYISNLANPSHVLIHLLLKMKKADIAIDFALKLQNNLEKFKSLQEIISYLIQENRLDKARELVKIIKGKNEKAKIYAKIAEKYLEDGKEKEALHLAEDVDDAEEKDAILEEISVQLCKSNRLQQALATAEKIQDHDTKSYTYSRLVHILSSKGKCAQAIEIAFTIQDKGSREDAFSYIVKKLLELRQIDEALKFVDMIKNPKEKSQAAKIVESAMVAYREDEKVKRVRNLFSLMKSPTLPHER